MSIPILSRQDIEAMHRAGRVAALTLEAVCKRIEAGISTAQIDQWVREDTRRRGAKPSQLGYQGFPAAVCVSPNHVVCHGIPNQRTKLQDGDIVNIDVTSEFEGFHGDTSRMVWIGTPSPAAQHVSNVARLCRDAGISVVRDGARLGDIGAAIEEIARAHGCGVVEQLGGHGIGRKMHQAPHVSHTGKRGRGIRLRAGMAITIEPMITIGSPALVTQPDGWTIVTADGSPSAQYEHTIIVTETGAEITTRPPSATNLAKNDHVRS